MGDHHPRASAAYEPVPQRLVPHAPLHTFKVRRGRLTARHEDALARLWPTLGLRVDGTPTDLVQLFGRSAPVVLDVGSGMGEATARAAAADPTRDVLAVDVHTPGLANLLALVADAGLNHVRVADGDVRLLLGEMLAPAALDQVRIWFPDPWPKARHAKRRLVTTDFLDLVATRLRPGGTLSFATDWAPYAGQVAALLEADGRFTVVSRERPSWRPETKFEGQGRAAGRASHDLVAVLSPDPPGPG
ncbi:MAG: tRNA (guanine-N7)-methyltransferase [Frankiales bacterium]|nr:tRNA (guanine-N7)-methyltransferase [Frankiales bacterium]